MDGVSFLFGPAFERDNAELGRRFELRTFFLAEFRGRVTFWLPHIDYQAAYDVLFTVQVLTIREALPFALEA